MERRVLMYSSWSMTTSPFFSFWYRTPQFVYECLWTLHGPKHTLNVRDIAIDVGFAPCHLDVVDMFG